MHDLEKMRPPYVRFDRRALEDRTKQQENGKYAFRDVDFAFITVPGNKDTVEREVEGWLRDLQKRGEDGLCPSSWYPHFVQQYAHWKKGEEAPLNGTAIKDWTGLTPAQQKTVIQAGVLTVEDLAAANDSTIQAIGMGAINFRQKAQAWLKAAEGPGKLAEENARLQAQIDALTEQVKSLSARIKKE